MCLVKGVAPKYMRDYPAVAGILPDVTNGASAKAMYKNEPPLLANWSLLVLILNPLDTKSILP